MPKPFSVFSLPAGLADELFADATGFERVRQQGISPDLGLYSQKKAAPEGAASLTGRKSIQGTQYMPLNTSDIGTKWLTMYFHAVENLWSDRKNGREHFCRRRR
jgi:hypothetical protein